MNQELQAVIEKEGNYKQFTHEGFTCFIRRGPMGALNGYVILEQGHRYFGKDYHFINPNANVDVHKGLTFSETATTATATAAAAETGWSKPSNKTDCRTSSKR